MPIQFGRLPLLGLQFHPESILTEHGYALLAAFLRLAGLSPPPTLPSIESELVTESRAAPPAER